MNDEAEEDWALFRRAMKDVDVWEHDEIMPPPPRLKPIPRQRYLDDEQVMQDALSDQFDPFDLETGEELVFLRPCVQRAMLRKLRRGHYSVGAELDLHGLLVPEARQAITEFLRQCRHRQIFCARIIHGKGHGSHQKQPILKGKLNHWLRQYDQILAFCSARNIDGGTGAVYVLMKKS
jgi:DNA-nicking Smr family endonuclease